VGTGSYNTLILNDNPENSASAKVSNGISQAGDIISVELGVGGGFMTRYILK
jgi:hypothetical protein